MTQLATVSVIIAAAWALSGCGVNSPDAGGTRWTQNAPQLLAELQSLPDGHPPVPGLSSTPALPEGHPRCPASGILETPASDAEIDQALQSPPELIST